MENKLSLEEEKKETKCIDIRLDSLILSLKIISKLKPGCKLSIKENNGIINNGSSEIKNLRAELKTMLFTIARNGQKIEAILNGWEGQGLPSERGF